VETLLPFHFGGSRKILIDRGKCRFKIWPPQKVLFILKECGGAALMQLVRRDKQVAKGQVEEVRYVSPV